VSKAVYILSFAEEQDARLMLSGDQCDRNTPLLQGESTDPGRTAGDNRLFVEAVLSDRRIVCARGRAAGLPQVIGEKR
jgi:hypothetical protein